MRDERFTARKTRRGTLRMTGAAERHHRIGETLLSARRQTGPQYASLQHPVRGRSIGAHGQSLAERLGFLAHGIAQILELLPALVILAVQRIQLPPVATESQQQGVILGEARAISGTLGLRQQLPE